MLRNQYDMAESWLGGGCGSAYVAARLYHGRLRRRRNQPRIVAASAAAQLGIVSGDNESGISAQSWPEMAWRHWRLGINIWLANRHLAVAAVISAYSARLLLCGSMAVLATSSAEKSC